MQNIVWNSFTNSTIFIKYLPFVKQVEEIKRPKKITAPSLENSDWSERQIHKLLQFNTICPLLKLCPQYNEKKEQRVPKFSRGSKIKFQKLS